ncbi:MAG: CHAT domain-containing protein [Bacteroidetes bacterium]|nr:CHAT domain-containing protein [Bacteroidota bacterium]
MDRILYDDTLIDKMHIVHTIYGKYLSMLDCYPVRQLDKPISEEFAIFDCYSDGVQSINKECRPHNHDTLNRSFICILFSGLLCSQSMASDMTDSLTGLGWTDFQIVEWMEAALPGSSQEEAFGLYLSISEILDQQGLYAEALTYQDKCIETGKFLALEKGDVYRDAVNDKAYTLMDLGSIKSAERWVRENIETEINDWRFIKLCFFYADILGRLGDLTLAEIYLQKALRISVQIGNDRYASRSLVRLSELFLRSGNNASIINMYKQLDNHDFLTKPAYKMTILYNLSGAFLQIGDYKKALDLSNEVIKYGHKSDQDTYVMWGLINKGYAERELGDLQAAILSFRQAMRFETVLGWACNNMAETYLEVGIPDSAVWYSKKAMKLAGFTDESNAGVTNELSNEFLQKLLALPAADKISQLDFAHDLARGLTARGVTENDPTALGEAMRVNEALDQIIDEFRMTTFEQQSKHFWRSEVKPIYDDAIHTAYLIGDHDKAFYYAEKSKAVLLLDELLRNTTARDGLIPDSLLDREFSIKQKIVELELELQEELQQEEKDSMTDQLLAVKRDLVDLIQQISVVAPQYVSTKYSSPVSSLNDLGAIYSGDHTAISLIWAGDIIYRFMVNGAKTSVRSFKADQDFMENLALVLNGCKRPLSNLDAIYDLNKASVDLYEQLFGDLEGLSGQLTIFPDGPLYYLPFEALVKNRNPGSPEYLIEDCVIHYGYSANTNVAGNWKDKSRSILVFAPESYSTDMKLAPLSYYDFEVEQVLNKHTIELKGPKATKDGLLTGMSGKKIIHIYSHAAANDTTQPNPWIAARNDRIFLPEIYNQRVSADLVILSACETSLGEEVKGEGVISLARGFFHAGAGSVLASLWSVNDRSNSEIVHHFYRHLKKGKTKAEAIRLSKLHFMEHHKLEARSPYYWAGVVYIGKDGKLEQGSMQWWKYLLIAVGGLAALGLGYYNIRKQAA